MISVSVLVRGGGEGFLSRGDNSGVQDGNGSRSIFGKEGGINVRFAKNSSGSKISRLLQHLLADSSLAATPLVPQRMRAFSQASFETDSAVNL